jgi:hypothetical protein
VQSVNIFKCLNVVVCVEHEVQVFVCGCEVSLYCVCIYRCIYLRELAACGSSNVTDAGISMVISHCSQLCVLDLNSLEHITGMCALCEDAEHILCVITLCFMNSFIRFITDHKGPPFYLLVISSYLHSLFCNAQLCSLLWPNRPIIIILGFVPGTVVFPSVSTV